MYCMYTGVTRYILWYRCCIIVTTMIQGDTCCVQYMYWYIWYEYIQVITYLICNGVNVYITLYFFRGAAWFLAFCAWRPDKKSRAYTLPEPLLWCRPTDQPKTSTAPNMYVRTPREVSAQKANINTLNYYCINQFTNMPHLLTTAVDGMLYTIGCT